MLFLYAQSFKRKLPLSWMFNIRLTSISFWYSRKEAEFTANTSMCVRECIGYATDCLYLGI